jgi:hypothetical protein
MTLFALLERLGFDLPQVFSDETLKISSDGALVIRGAQSLNRPPNDFAILETLHQYQLIIPFHHHNCWPCEQNSSKQSSSPLSTRSFQCSSKSLARCTPHHSMAAPIHS